MINANIKVTGRLKVDLYRDGVLVQEGQWFDNVVTTAGKNALASLLNSASGGTSWVTNIGFGTGSTAVAASDTSLTTELTTTNYSGYARPIVSRSNPSGNVIQYVASLTGGTPSGGDVIIQEVGLFNAATTGTLVCHQLTGAVTLSSSSDSLQITWQVTFS